MDDVDQLGQGRLRRVGERAFSPAGAGAGRAGRKPEGKRPKEE